MFLSLSSLLRFFFLVKANEVAIRICAGTNVVRPVNLAARANWVDADIAVPGLAVAAILNFLQNVELVECRKAMREFLSEAFGDWKNDAGSLVGGFLKFAEVFATVLAHWFDAFVRLAEGALADSPARDNGLKLLAVRWSRSCLVGLDTTAVFGMLGTLSVWPGVADNDSMGHAVVRRRRLALSFDLRSLDKGNRSLGRRSRSRSGSSSVVKVTRRHFDERFSLDKKKRQNKLLAHHTLVHCLLLPIFFPYYPFLRVPSFNPFTWRLKAFLENNG